MGHQDHPREYGENRSGFRAVQGVVGPSPRIRGELRIERISNLNVGTIPANTGRILADLRKPDRQE